jgi:PAS domain S-box-containing protein
MERTAPRPAEPELGPSHLLEAMPDGVLGMGDGGRIVIVNLKLCELSGHRREELLGQPLEVLVPERFRAGHVAFRDSYEGSGHPVRAMGSGLEIVLRCADGGEIPVDIALSPMPTDAGIVVVASVRDATERRRAEALMRGAFAVATTVLGGAPVDESLALIARQASALVRGDIATIATAIDDDALLVRSAEGEGSDALAGLVFPRDDSISGHVLLSGEPELVADAPSDRRVHQPIVALGDIGPALFVPLSAKGEPFGTLMVARVRGSEAFTQADVDAVASLAAQAAVAIEFARAQEEVQRLVVFEDRERIARDLHDTVIQQLFAVGMSLQAVARALPTDDLAERVQGAIDDLDTTIRDIRSTIFALESSRRRGHGFRNDVLSLVAESAGSLGFEPRVRLEGALDAVVPDDIAEHALSTLREALSNVARHAKASRVDVHLSVDDRLRLVVTDDGVGPPAADGRRGLGLRNMTARADEIGGTLALEPADPGTRLCWEVPV